MITKLEIDEQLYQQQCHAVVNMINQAKAEYYSVTLATAGAKDMFHIVNCLISHQDKALPSGDSDLVLAKIVELGKVSQISPVLLVCANISN